MTDSLAQHEERDIQMSPPEVYHRQTGTPTKSSHSRQQCQSQQSSPASESKKRKREASEASDDADGVSRPSSPQPTSSRADQTAQLDPSTVPQISGSSVGKSPSMASVNPCDRTMPTDHDVSNDQQSSAPDETATVEDGVVWRSREKLAACLSCDLCSGVLKDPVTAPECMHSFCRDCIDQHVLFGGTKNICPVCKVTGLQTVFGPQPFQHGKLQFDPMLADLIRKLFPRADVEESIQQRHDAEAKFRASLPVKKHKIGSAKTPTQTPAPMAGSASSPAVAAAAVTLQSSHVSPSHAQNVPASKVGLFLQITDPCVRLNLPYLWVQQSMPLKSLNSYVCGQLQLDEAVHRLRLECEGAVLHQTATLQTVSGQWYSTHPATHLIVIQISIEQKAALAGNLVK